VRSLVTCRPFPTPCGVYPRVREMAVVQSHIAREFMKKERQRGVAPKTYNSLLILMRSVFHALRRDAGMPENPFDGIPTLEAEQIFRKPFSAEELGLIVAAAKADLFIYPAIIVGICTAMRRGDCCTLRKDAVDMKAQFIRVKTSKTGEYVQIPIFPLLLEVVKGAFADEESKGSPFVIPKLEMRYQLNPDHITARVRRVMRSAGFFDPDNIRYMQDPARTSIFGQGD
jgi:integrase